LANRNVNPGADGSVTTERPEPGSPGA